MIRLMIALLTLSAMGLGTAVQAENMDQYASKIGQSEKKQEAQRQKEAYKKGKAAGANYSRGQAARDNYGSMNDAEKAEYKRGFRGQ